MTRHVDPVQRLLSLCYRPDFQRWWDLLMMDAADDQILLLLLLLLHRVSLKILFGW
jgi:hypothetical protein